METYVGKSVDGIPFDEQGNVNTAKVDLAFVNIAYLSTMSVVYDSMKPNFEVHLTGNLDLTITGASNGNSGMVNLYFSGTEVATLNGVTNLVVTGSGEMIPIYFVTDSDGLKWYKDEKGGATVDTSLLALQDGTILYHTAIATSGGTFSNVGNICTGIGTTITNEMVGAKIIKANGETGIIATRTSDTEFTTETAFATDSTNTAFEVKCIAYRINPNGNILTYSKLGVLFSELKIYNDGGDRLIEFFAFIKANVFSSGQIFIGNSYMKAGYVESDYFRQKVYLFENLPIGIPPGTVAMISDATTPTWHGIVVGGGTELSPVYFDGVNWRIY